MIGKANVLMFIPDGERGAKLVNMLVKYKGSYSSYTPVFLNRKEAKDWIKQNKPSLAKGSYFLGTVTEDNKVKII